MKTRRFRSRHVLPAGKICIIVLFDDDTANGRDKNQQGRDFVSARTRFHLAKALYRSREPEAPRGCATGTRDDGEYYRRPCKRYERKERGGERDRGREKV